MDFAKILILSVSSMAVLFLLTKLMGYRQISELNFFDYVIGITIGSIAAEMSTNIDLEWWKGITAMCVYAFIGVLFSVITQKSIKARKLISGEPIVLMENGRIIRKNMKKAKLDINDLLASARTNGYFNLSDIDYVIMETTGKISFLPTPLKRQLNPKDFNFAPQRESININVISDASYIEDGLKKAKITQKQLSSMLKNRDEKLENIALAFVDADKKLTIINY